MKTLFSKFGWLSIALLINLLTSAQVWAEYEEIIYYHNDALGSPVMATDANGNVKWEEDYMPFGKRLEYQSQELVNGEPQEDAWDETVWYTGKQEEARLGLTHMGARWYDPSVGRFWSPDPVGFVEQNPMSFNRYLYVNNNPYKYNDPDGEFLNFVIGGVKAAIENTLIQTAEIALGQRESFSYGELALETAVGTVTSGLSSIKNAGKLAALGSKVLKKRRGANKVPDKLYHYTSSKHADSIVENGLRPGSSGKVFTTPDGAKSGLQAQIDLALPPNRGVPDALIEIDTKILRKMGIKVPKSTQVKRDFNMPGGGKESVFDTMLPPEALRRVK